MRRTQRRVVDHLDSRMLIQSHHNESAHRFMPTHPVTYLVGAGGHARVIADILVESGHPPTAFLDDAPKHNRIGDIRVIQGLELPEPNASVIVAVGDNFVRATLAARYSTFGVAIHPSAWVSRHAEIGPGSVVMAGAVINAGTRIGAHCIINTCASVDHDCLIDDFAHVAPGATLGGNVHVGSGTMIGLGANVIHGIAIGEHTVIGAGSTVVRDLPSSVVAFGSPARVIRAREIGDRYL
jgi:sugar O-acyltransferase (sialic acid O-acetyltransferase NeuD family)